MTRTLRLLLVAGARPNFMKVAPIVHRLRKRAAEGLEPLVTYRLVHTGQHYDERMSAVFFDELDIPRPDVNLGVGSGSHAVQTARVMEAFEPVCRAEKPDWVVVVGDVNSTIACALVGAKLGIPRRPRRGRSAQLRPHHARGDQPDRHRRARRPAADTIGGRRREPAPRRHLPGTHPSASAT